MNKGNTAVQAINLPQEYQYGYTDGYIEGYDIGYRMRRKEEHRRQARRAAKISRQLYFFEQKALGVLLLLLTLWTVYLLDGDATFAILSVPISCKLIFSREMLLVNRYYYESMERRRIRC